MNYYDLMSEKWSNYIDFMNRRQIQAVSPKIKIYPLFRKNGPDDKVVNESINRIYLPYYTIRGHYIAQDWTQSLGKTSIIEEDVAETTIVLNLEDMVKTVRNLKNLSKSEFVLKYVGNSVCSIWKSGSVFYIKLDCNTTSINLDNYSAKTFMEYLNTLVGFSVVSFKDGFENASNIINFDKTDILSGDQVKFYSRDFSYNTLDDKINIGDLIVTHHNVLYEVGEAKPGNLKFVNYPQYILKCFKKNLMDNTKLPDNGLNEIFEDGYLLNKYKNVNFIR